MKKILALAPLFILCISTISVAQVQGVSTDKLAAFNAETLPLGLFELEPTFSYARSLGYFDNENSYKENPGIIISSVLSFRAAYGLGKNWEIGANVSTELNTLSLSTKYYLIGNEKIGFGLIAGINSDITNGARTLSSLNRQVVFGITNHYNFSDIFSISSSIQFQDSREYLGNDIFINSEVGYYISEEMMLVAGLGWSKYSNSDVLESNLFSLFPGFNYEKKMFVVALQTQFDLLGKNIDSYNGVSVSITQLLR